MDNIFCIDLEDWYHQSLIPRDGRDPEPRVERNTERLLEMFDDSNTRATFFCLGQIAERHPELIRRVRAAGHEIACHGYNHETITSQQPESFRQDVSRAKSLLEDICGEPVIGYRAPSWTITKKTLWALDILKELGFKYDSSIFPVSNFLYGIPDAPVFANQITVGGEPFWEIPPATFSLFGKNMGFSGGFYFRVFPAAVIRYITRGINKKGMPAVFYLHPVEIDAECPKVKAPIRDRLILYWGIGGCERKLRSVLAAYNFVSIKDFYKF